MVQISMLEAVEWGKIQVTRLLLKHGADVNARDESGENSSQLVHDATGDFRTNF
jgi:hypothetical protein